MASASGHDIAYDGGFESTSGILALKETTLSGDALQHFRRLPLEIPSAIWYEREIHDLFGLCDSVDIALDDALVLPLARRGTAPTSRVRHQIVVGDHSTHATSELGWRGRERSRFPMDQSVPVSLSQLSIWSRPQARRFPPLNLRVSYKHRGIEKSFEGLNVDDGVLLAERYEGVASVAHAIAFCGAVESIGESKCRMRPDYVRVIHAELERMANHLDSSIRHVEASGQAVAFARLSFHKERIQRLRSRLCGSRFGRGVVVPGGVSGSTKASCHRFARRGRRALNRT